MPWRPMSPLSRTTSPARTARGPTRQRVLDRSDARGFTYKPSPFAALDDLGVAGDDLHPGGPGGFPIERTTRSSVPSGSPSSKMNPTLSQRGRAPAHGEVVDRAVDREAADVAAGKKERLDDVESVREREPGAGEVRPAPPRHGAQSRPELANTGPNTRSINSCVNRPPPPCAIWISAWAASGAGQLQFAGFGADSATTPT